MFCQNQVLRTLTQPDAWARLDTLVSEVGAPSRPALARPVDPAFDFFDARGRWPVSTCARALRTLAERKRGSWPVTWCTPAEGGRGSQTYRTNGPLKPHSQQGWTDMATSATRPLRCQRRPRWWA